MRFAWIAGLTLLAGCASTQGDDSTKLRYSGDGLDYSVARPIDDRPDGATADLTLVELDAEFAEELLFIDGPADIAPRAFTTAMGEIAAVNAAYGHGVLLTRTTIRLNNDGTTAWEWGVEYTYLQDWVTEKAHTPLFDTIWSGVRCELGVNAVDDRTTEIVAKTTSSQLLEPVPDFRTRLGKESSEEIQIQLPSLSVMERTATETVSSGGTAMFQLSRKRYDSGERVRLLFVCLVPADE